MYDLKKEFSVIDQAYPTSRLLDGSSDHGFAEEWVERVEQDGKEYDVYYLFSAEDIVYDDGESRLAEDYPWDDEHVSKVEEVEE